MTVRTFPLAGGAVALGIGAALAAHGEPVLPEGPLRFVALAAAALVAVGIGVVDVLARSLADHDASLPDAGGTAVPTPGDELDEQLFGDGRGRVHSRLESAAVSVLARREGDTRERARERLRAGSWTEDPRAAALFADAASPSLRERLGALVRGEPAIVGRVRAATSELLGAEDERGERAEGEG